MRLVRLVICALLVSGPALAENGGEAETEIRAAIVRWYDELLKKQEGRVDLVVGRPFFEATRHYRYADDGSAALGPRIYSSLAARALQFTYDIEIKRVDPNFARVAVWERGYFYAAAAQRTYENAADSDFILERQEKDGKWRIVAYRSGSYGIPPGKRTDPMPDLRDLYYSTVGKDRDPEADAREAAKF